MTTDQRGQPRKGSTRGCEVGAFEEVFQITPLSLPNAVVGASYNVPIVVTSGGSGSYSYALETGSGLPPGFSSVSSGSVTGVPTTAGTYSFTIQITDSTGLVGTVYYQLVVNNPTATATATNTASVTTTNTGTATATNTASVTASNTNTATATNTASITASNTATGTNTATFTPSNTPTVTASNTVTATNTASATSTVTVTSTATPTSTNTQLPARIDSIGVYRPGNGTFYLRLHNSAGASDLSAEFNPATKPLPIVGD